MVRNRNIFLGVLALTAAVLAIALLLPAGQVPIPRNVLPWDVEHTADGHTRVFGLVPGVSTLENAEMRLRDQPEVTLFAKPGGAYAMEAYFDRLDMAGLAARMVLTLKLDQTTLAGMYGRGIRVSTMGSGTRRVTLAPEDLARVGRAPIDSITYLPLVSLDSEMVASRFGEPAQRIRETESGTEHLLYPSLGLDVALNPKGKEVFQYVAPDRFGALTAPLLGQGKPQP